MKPERHITQPFVVVGCVISNTEGKLLLLNEGGKWNLPAGWLELEESLIEGAKREAEEETGREVVIDGVFGIYTLIKQRPEKVLHAIKFIYSAHFTGNKTETLERIASEWFTPQEVYKLEGQFWDPDVFQIVKDWEAGKKCILDRTSTITIAQQ